jgi:flagellar basal-body rod protein FlgB
MIDALFNTPNYLAAKKTLDVVALRQEAISSNIENLETPGYKRIDIAPTFQAELDRACASGNSRQIASLTPSLAPDPTALPNGRDGNTVSLERELMLMSQNTLTNALETQLVSGTFSKLRMAITGKS